MIPKRFLLIKLRAMGDTVILTSSIQALRRAHSKAIIDVIVTEQWSSLLENTDGIRTIIPYERRPSKTARARNLSRLALKLRKEKYDAVLNFHASTSSALLSFASGAQVRAVHFHDHNRKNSYSTVTIPDKGIIKAIIERDLDVLRAIGIEVNDRPMPVIQLSDAEVNEGAERIAKLKIAGPYLGFGLGASRPSKIWPLDRFAKLSREWKEKTGGSVLTFTHENESVLTEEIDRLSRDIEIRHFRSLDLREMAATLKHLTVFVGNDSGPRHVAAAVGTPTVTLIGPENPLEWHPYPVEHHPYLYTDGLACRRDAQPGYPAWCGLDVCETEDHRCMKSIQVDRVLEECQRIAR